MIFSSPLSLRLRRLSSAAVTALSLLNAPAHGAGAQGLDGVELEAVPLDAGTDCSSIILRGTRRFQGTAFVMPRVLVGITREGEDLFQISPDDDGTYTLSLGLYFPDSSTNLDLRAGRSTLFLHGCDFEAALHQINRDVKDPKQQVSNLARLPVQNIEVAIDGLKNRAIIGEVAADGRPGTSILNYEGNDHTVEFKMTAAEKEGLLRRLKRQQGISIRVNMRFTARANDGALYAEVDLDQLATSLQTQLGGKYLIASADLKVAIERSVSQMHINIQTEAGSSQTFQKIADSLMTLILANVTQAPASPHPSGPSASADLAQPVPPVPAPAPSPKPPVRPLPGTDMLLFAPMLSFNGRDLAVRHAMSAPPAADDSNAGGGPASIKVSAVISYLKTQKKSVINYSNTSELQTAVYTTPVNLQARLQDPDVREVVIRSGETPSALPGEIKKGDHVTIGVAKTIREKIQYFERKTYLSANEITRLDIGEVFPDILADDFIIHNEDTKQGFLAVGKRIRHRPLWLSDYVYPQRYFWVREQWGPLYGVEREIPLEPTLEALKDLSLRVSFSRVGIRQFQIYDIVQDNAYWSASYDGIGGKIELVAKRNLGYMTIAGVAPVVKNKMTIEQIFEETRQDRQPIVRSEPQKVREKSVPVERLSYQIFVGRPAAEGSSVQYVTPQGVPGAPEALPSTGSAR